MNHRDEDLERNLRATLDSHAEAAPLVDLTDAAVRRASRIRTRRRVAAGLVAAAVVAVAVPIGIQLSDPSSDQRQATSHPPDDATTTPADSVNVEITGMAPGPAPQIPYVDGDTYTKDRTHVIVRSGSGIITDAIAVSDGLLVWRQDDNATVTYTAIGTGATLPQGTSASNPAVDVSTGSAAWAVRGVDGKPGDADTVVVANSVATVTGSASAESLKVDHVMGVKAGEVVFNAHDDGRQVVGRIDVLSEDATVEEPWTGVATLTAIDPDFTRIAAVLTGDREACSTMLDYADAAEEWTSCTWRPVEFSPDGSRVLAVGNTEGLGPNELAVMDAATGDVLQQFVTAGVFGRMTFEDSQTIVGVVAVGDQTAIVRCTVDGDCELATQPRQVPPDEPDSVLTPYQITAN